MTAADQELLGALLDDVLDASIVRDAVEEAVQIIVGEDTGYDAGPTLEQQIAKMDQERAPLVSAIAAGGMMESLLAALRERETDALRGVLGVPTRPVSDPRFCSRTTGAKRSPTIRRTPDRL